MLHLKKHLIIGAVAAGIGFSVMSSFAQMPPPGPNGGHPPSAEQMAKFEQHRAKREAKWHDKLKITAAQEDAWKIFIGKITPVRPATPPTPPSKEELSKLTTPQRLDLMQEHVKKREEHMAQRIAATKEFYAVLSPEQQKLFDEEFRKMEKRRFKHGWSGHGHDMDDAPAK